MPRLFFLTVILFFPVLIFSQSLDGYLYDEQHQPLIGGNILLYGTNSGTASNNDGFYSLRLQPGSYKIIVSYIGFLNDTVSVKIRANEKLQKDFSLKPATIIFRETLVFSKKLNSAEEIALHAIYWKEEYLSKIKNYEYSAYSKTKFILKPDSTKEVIGGITEVQSKGYFQAPDNFQEVILAKRQTANFSELYNIFSSGKIISALDDIMNIDELAVISPLNTKALDYYQFDMIDTTYYNLKRVFNLSIKPKSSTLPLFEGRISIIDDIYCVVDIQLYGRDRIKSTIKSDVVIKQSFREFENYFWLPVQFNMWFNLDIGLPGVRKLYINQQSSLTNYVINNLSFDHDFNNKLLVNANLNKQSAKSTWDSSQYVELTKDEKDAYKSIDSSMASKTFLIKFLIDLPGLYLKIKRLPFTELWDFYRFNRVEGNYLGVGFKIDSMLSISNFKFAGGYGFSDKHTKYDVEIYHFLIHDGLQLHASFFNTIRLLNKFYDYRKYDLTFQQIFFNKDYADYFYSNGWSAGFDWNLDYNYQTSLSFSQNNDCSALNNSAWSLFNKNRTSRMAVPIAEGLFNHIDFSINYDNRKYLDYGWGSMQNYAQNYLRFELNYEAAPKQVLKNKYPYQQMYLFVNSFSKLSPYANLNLSFEAGYLDNDSLPQKSFHLPGAYGSLSSPHLFRTLKQDSYLGNTYAAVFFENNFKNTIFNLLSLPFLKNSKYDLYIFGNYGWIKNKVWHNGLDLKDRSDDFSEIGFGIGNVFFYVRLDFSWRIAPRQERNFYFNFSSVFH